MTGGLVKGESPSLRRNVIANYVGKLWSIASVYVFVPFYIQILGVDSYGLIAFYSVALAILFIADAGLSASFTREAARERNMSRLSGVLRGIERVLLLTLTISGLLMILSAKMISVNWLNVSDSLSADLTVDCLRLMPLALVPQVAMSLYIGGLMGLERQVKANVLTTLFSIVRSGIVVLPIYFFPDPRVFFVWQIIASWIFMFVVRSAVKRELKSEIDVNTLSWKSLKPVLSYAAGMFAVSIIAGLNTQLDKIIVSSLRSLEEFAYYSIAGILAQIPTLLTMPIAVALLPRLTQMVELKQTVKLRSLYEFNSYLIASISSASAFTLFFFVKDVATLWMPNRIFPDFLFPVIQILSIGGLFLALQLTPFQLSLANGHTKTNARLGIGMMIIMIPLQYYLTVHFGLIGAATPWLLLNGVACIFLGITLNRLFNGGYIASWFFRCTLPPVIISAIVLYIARSITNLFNLQPFASCALAALFALAAVMFNLLIWAKLNSIRSQV
jgi:O-antigen/teichoic acid export membrane protein